MLTSHTLGCFYNFPKALLICRVDNCTSGIENELKILLETSFNVNSF